ncbi:probable anion transporter 1, chloroplastic isoform X2 [Elaeis guineensis]|uniref:Probable anion transporter 1, chloroplastic isoform X2 n=1 Tax=Elaeis guineensis var. tenera TaxID=51953 RepID=A0A6I9RAI8_ELAGV|nr:probable anion transporter 1, chloroplastic isoform X2 [Elaeis guineensis]
MNGAGVYLLPLSSPLRTPLLPNNSKSGAPGCRGGAPLEGGRISRSIDPWRSECSCRRRKAVRRARTRGADLQSEVSDSSPESINFRETLSEAVSPPREEEEEEEEDGWVAAVSSLGLDKFPKRWVIVILCFSAFLLCNMDRVNMSIAILPMSAEFNWNPATVGLIQSSFFWGYLLTQIAGGVWADTVGGKTVLGFGVVWWSIATALTPVAAKIGLPFLLVVRAFMGIGEAYSSPLEDPGLRAEEKKLIESKSVANEPVRTIPWRLILSKPPVWALIVSHFCHNWGTFILLTWMPTYYNQVLKFNLTESGLFCVLPWLTMAFSANIGGWIADTLVSKGLSVTMVRKIMQSIGFLGPAFFLTQLSHIHSPAMAVLCMACSQGTDAFSQSGLYSNHQDIGPRYAGVLLGLSNTAGVLAGVFGTAATGYILQHGSWDDVFKVSVALYLAGTVVWNLFSTGEKILD